jgi:hypothetical protein
MAAVGGPFIEITYNHPVLGTGALYPKGDEDSEFDLGGVRTEDDDNGVDASGEMIKTMTPKRWSVEATVSNDMNTRQEMEKLVALAGEPADADWTFTHINGTIYGGKGAVVGDLKGAARAATISFKVQGGGKMKQL